MSQQRPRDDPASRPITPRHRRSAVLSVASWLSAARGSTRGMVVAASVLVLILVLVGYAVLSSRERTVDIPPLGGPTGQPLPAAPPAVPAAPPSATATPSDDPGDPAPDDPGPDGAGPDDAGPDDAGPDDDVPDPPQSRGPAPRPEATEPPEPRLIGPKNLDSFTGLLSTFCQDRKFRTAVLLDGPEGKRNAGNWVCVKIVDFTPINLDDACRTTFGNGAKARQLERGDSRTWRCFDS